ncbi:MAG: hypothetical protein M3167_00265 [Acidobacteriota bacterium]|nr:hypothetical protein [Acidobacteriota bacterium]
MITTVNWQFIILDGNPATGFRVKRRTGGPPPIVNSGTDTPNRDDWASSTPAPPTIRYTDGRDYVFAFWSLSAHDALSGQSSAHVQQGPTANDSHTGGVWTITAKAYYVWSFGVGGGPNAVLIDAFDVQAGDFIADDFVDVTPDANGTLTSDANNGYLNTTTQIAQGASLKIKARDAFAAKQFGYWQSVPSLLFSNDPNAPATVGASDAHDIIVHYNDVVVAFAFYNEVKQTIVLRPQEWGLYNPWWWIETHGGLTPGPVPPPWADELIAGLALGGAARGVAPPLRASVLRLAVQQISLAVASLKREIKGLQGK